MSHISLTSYYETFFAMMQHHNYSLTELENMMPWEREVYIGLLQEHIAEENARIEREQAAMKRG